ncbi:MAG: chorismate synthase [Firmicutes bacterium]|nr:chorismate synthase [Bacillota bacterium]
MNTFGENIRMTIFGESHGAAVGAVLDGLPAGEIISLEKVKEQMARRAPGSTELGTPRKEGDEPYFMSGVLNGFSTGAPICAMIRNEDANSKAYSAEVLRPSHADYVAKVKYKGFSDYRGGGPFSGRLTAAFVLCGAICRQSLERRRVTISSRIVRVGQATGDDLDFAMKKEILDARAAGDSVGAVIECVADGVPVGTGGLMFGGLESRLGMLFFAIPGVKGLEFGSGFQLAAMRGSEANDPIRVEGGRVVMGSNHAGGINGGLANGMPIVARIALRPTPSIAREQQSIDLGAMENRAIRITGRHDPCLAPRAQPVVEAAMAFCLLDAMLGE